MNHISDKLYEISKRFKLSIVGAIFGMIAPIAKIAGDYFLFGKSFFEQIKNPEQIFNYALITAGAIIVMTLGGALIHSIVKLSAEERFIDPLTGVYNKRYLKKTEEEIMRSKKNKRKAIEKFTIAIIDLDNFKPVNDLFGHKVGDLILVKIVQKVFKSEMKRPGDKIFRIGGDEFMLYMPETDAKGANAIIERMKKKISKIRVGKIHLGFSVGVVSDRGSTDIEKLKIRADKIMYAEKKLRKKIKI